MNPPERLLPDREIAYNYTAAMYFSQQFEVNLKAILHTIDYSFEDLEAILKPSELKRFKTFEHFLGKATSGSLKSKMAEAGVNLPEQAWKALDEACEVRNDLAHSYLERLRLPPPNEEHHDAILNDIKKRAIVLYKAMMITRTLREKLERSSQEQHMNLCDFLRDCGVNADEINRGIWENRNTD